MSAGVLFFTMFGSCCFILVLLLPWISQSSLEAERMFVLVKSNREDKRLIGMTERMVDVTTTRIRQARQVLGGGKNEKMLRRFAEAGLRGPNIADIFLLAQLLCLLLGGVLGSFVSSNPFFCALLGGVVGFMAPDLWLSSRKKRRKHRIRRSIPDMVDLLVICVGAGLGLDQALIRVAEELRLSHPEIAEEVERVMLERRAGASRIDAWRGLAERTNIKELAAFVSMLSETDRFGSPITKALVDFAEGLRTGRRQKAEEAAAKTKVKIIFPLVICIFPCIFIVLLVPAILSFMHSFSGFGR